MLDKFDYAEPSCVSCSGEDFYYPKSDAPLGHIPVDRIIQKLDGLFDKNDYTEAARLLEYWKNEAVSLKDMRGELAVVNELIGYMRKTGDKDKGLCSINRAFELIDRLEINDTVSCATTLINCATAYKAFGMENQALPLYLRAEELYKKYLSPTDSRFGGLYNNMALVLVDLGETDKAKKAYLSALDVMKNIKGGEAECAITYINMAYMHEATGDIGQMYECMDKAHELLQSENIVQDGSYAFVLEKCAPAFIYFGKKDIGDEMKRKATVIYERA